MQAAYQEEAKLVAHRWSLHAVQAVAHHHSIIVRRVFTELGLPVESSVNTQVVAFGFGAPFDFAGYGFFDRRFSTPATNPLFDRVEAGDTLLLLALRHHDPSTAIELVKLNASLTCPNAVGETPVQLLFHRLATVRLHERQKSIPDTGSPIRDAYNREQTKQTLAKQKEYIALFALVDEAVSRYHSELRAHVHKELTAVYEKFAPDRLAKIPIQLQEFEFMELVLLETVQRKYLETEPSQ
ncbi:TPA: hypothetical protein N0F65_006865 [Lagenidium giganteum]|uniref:Uncharacterized protein n=1 Tax=Lagenidium giganteum TaxID=4803 RepID=A0AAV2ZJU8_9STRA|nr:TPA: hypothetical protein N0F65_006865 [Lagenidium giganteum]